VALDQAPHHVGLAGRDGTPSRSPGCFWSQSAVNDLAALHEQRVHLLIDAVDLLAQVAQRRLSAGFDMGALIGGRSNEIKENVDRTGGSER
jgi:hypothetical protein